MLNKARFYTFYALDALKGGKIRKAYNDLQKYYEMDSDSKALIEYQEIMLEKLLQHAVMTTSYYKNYKSNTNLSCFPVVSKSIIKENQDGFLSLKYNKNKLIKVSTSGSTGTPFLCYQNIEKKRRVNAEIIFFSGKAGYIVGERLIFLRSLNSKTKKSKLLQWIQNEKLIDIGLLDDEHIESILNTIKKVTMNKSATLLTYASTCDVLRDYFKKHGIKRASECKINGIISSSEILFDETRRMMSKAFECNCYSRYANMENGVLGQDDPSHPNTFIVNEANYYIEILKMNNDEPADKGEVGRIVVTDLYNYAMPMIRYDTGDIGSITYIEKNGVRKKAITDFSGRKIDIIYNCDGELLSPHKISVVFWNFPEIRQFQFIQQGRTQYLVKLIVNGEFRKESELKKELISLLGNNATIKLEIVDEIPLLNSGKRKYIVNNITKV